MGISVISFSENTVKKVATGVYYQNISKHRIKNRDMSYIITTRKTGETGPSISQIKNEGRIMFQDDPENEYISADEAIDIYVLCSDGSKEDNTGYLILSGNTPGLGNVLSTTKSGIVITEFKDDFAAQGKAFQIQRIFTLTNAQTLYLVLDTTALVESGKRLIILPLTMQTSVGSVFVDTYPITSYTGGSEIKFARINSTIENYAESVFKSGITPTGTPGDELRQYIVGTESTNQSSGGGPSQADIPKRFPAGSIITTKLVNQESSTVTLSFGIVIYEI